MEARRRHCETRMKTAIMQPRRVCRCRDAAIVMAWRAADPRAGAGSTRRPERAVPHGSSNTRNTCLAHVISVIRGLQAVSWTGGAILILCQTGRPSTRSSCRRRGASTSSCFAGSYPGPVAKEGDTTTPCHRRGGCPVASTAGATAAAAAPAPMGYPAWAISDLRTGPFAPTSSPAGDAQVQTQNSQEYERGEAVARVRI
jgi:hypothetical protein